MECNKDEAIRAKTIAEGKMERNDYIGAKKFALKAQNLYPSLVGIAQMLTTIDVYISAEYKISGEVDWYRVLGVTPSVDDETLKKHYRKLALVLHPDKNSSIGADGAFKLLSEAWSLLSDKSKRLAYNQRISFNGFQQKLNTHKSGPSAPSRANGYQSSSSRSAATPKAQNTTAQAPPKAQNTTAQAPPKAQSTTAKAPRKSQNTTAKAPLKAKSTTTAKAPPKAHTTTTKASPKVQNSTSQAAPRGVPTTFQQRSNTFWTICHRCKMHYEYPRLYLNCSLLCPKCQEAFLASETSPPSNNDKSSYFASFQYNQGASARSSSGSLNRGTNAPRSVPNGHSPSSYADPMRGLPPRSAFGSSSSGSLDPGTNAARSGPTGHSSSSYEDPQQGLPPRCDVGNNLDPSIGATQAQGKVKRERDASNIHSSFTIGEEPLKKSRVGTDECPFEGNMDHQAANGFANFSSGSTEGVFYSSWLPGFLGKKPKGFRELTPREFRKMLLGKGQNEIQTKLNEWKSKIVTEVADVRNRNVKAAMQANYTKKQHNMNGDLAAETMSVPDPDFHDFDLDRLESSFGDSEVWAAYDDEDGMPRFYAMISNVISRVPFKVRIGWLNSKTNNEFSTIDWVGSGFYKTCGEFRVGRYEVSNSINSFSHKVKWFKGPGGTIHISPKKGDVWALYSNWSPDWNEHTPDEVVHKYEMVLVLDDYNEEQGISVTPLVKVAGFKTVFHQHMNPEKIKRIPKEEMFRFSHQVPNYFLTGEEVKNAPKDCQELDPAAIPVELLQVASVDEEKQVTNNHEDSKVMESQSSAQVC